MTTPAAPAPAPRGAGVPGRAAGPAGSRAPRPVAILGAGLAGLVAARELRRRGVPVEVFEASRRIAGLATTERDAEGFTYDFGVHFITNRLAREIGVADQCRIVRRYGETVRLRGRNHAYPFGLVASPRFFSSAVATRIRGLRRREPPATAAEWFRQNYGPALADAVAIPLVEAWSGAPATELAPSVGAKLGGMARPLLHKVASRLSGRAIASGYCREQPESLRVWHVYPEHGVVTLCERLAGDLGGSVHLESPVEAVYVEDGRAVGVRVRGGDREVAAVVSTAPVNVLPRLARGTSALAPLAEFRYRPMVFVNLRLRGRRLLPDVVTWTPEADMPFFRLTEAPLSMPWLAPEGHTIITADLGCEVGDRIWTMGDDALGELCLDPLSTIIPDVRRRYLGSRVMRTAIAYPVFLNRYEETRRRLETSTGVSGLYSIGRNGEFAHILMEDVYWRTLRRVDRIAADARSAA